MPTIRASILARICRFYPFYSGCGTLSNNPLFLRLAGTTDSSERLWCRVPSGEIFSALDDYVGRAAFYFGELDPKITWICKQLVRSGDTVLDIGANIGMVTLGLSKLVGDTGKIHAFEPNPELQLILQHTMERNKILNVRLHPFALGSRRDRLQLRIPINNAGAASLSQNRDLRGRFDVHEVPVRTLSEVVSEEKITSIRLIKIDVEGFEAEVFRGGQEVLRTIRPDAILFEMNERTEGKLSGQPVFEILRDSGYAFFSIPKCLSRMYLTRINPHTCAPSVGHDFLAAPEGECYESIATLVRARK